MLPSLQIYSSDRQDLDGSARVLELRKYSDTEGIITERTYIKIFAQLAQWATGCCLTCSVFDPRTEQLF